MMESLFCLPINWSQRHQRGPATSQFPNLQSFHISLGKTVYFISYLEIYNAHTALKTLNQSHAVKTPVYPCVTPDCYLTTEHFPC